MEFLVYFSLLKTSLHVRQRKALSVLITIYDTIQICLENSPQLRKRTLTYPAGCWGECMKIGLNMFEMASLGATELCNIVQD